MRERAHGIGKKLARSGRAMTQRLTNYLVYDFWLEYSGTRPRKFFDDHPAFFDTDGQMRLTYRISDAISERMVPIIERALEAWEEPTGIEFVQVDSGAQISFWKNNNWEDRAFTIWDIRPRDGDFDNIWSSSVVFNNSTVLWTQQAAYETALEEIGHALGLGHGGPYNGTDGAPIFPEDKHSVTVMSYVDDLPIAGPQEADYAAAAELYNPGPINAGNTVHVIDGDLHFHIEDHAGNDRIEWYATEENRLLDVRPGGVTKQASIGETTEIEDVVVMADGITVAVIYDDRVEIQFASGNEMTMSHGHWAFATWGFGA